MLFYCLALSLGWYFLFMNLLEEGPWYGLLIHFLISPFMVPGLVVAIAGIIYIACKGFIDFLFEAWKDFTVDVERFDPLV